jgi:carbonic anhydrase
MSIIDSILDNNKRWAAEQLAADPEFFSRLSAGQAPAILWLGCSDSRVPAVQVTGLKPGDLFVHRNIANMAPPGDVSSASVVQYAVDVLKVQHIVVCGHYGCGGVGAALGDELPQPINSWVDHVRAVRDVYSKELDRLDDHAERWARLCELNVAAQVENLSQSDTVKGAWDRGQPLTLHGWIYDLSNGQLLNLELTRSNN